MIIDADTHVLETEKTFEYLAKNERQFKPSVVTVSKGGDVNAAHGEHGKDMWLIDGQFYGKHDLGFIEDHSKGEITASTLDMSNPGARLTAMDRQGVDVAVIYPSLFLITAIADADAEMALARSYNRWLAELCASDPHRFKFALMVCPRRIEASIK